MCVRARACLHLFLSICLDDEVDLQQVAPAVWHSMRCLQFYNVAFSTLREQTFNNFKLSARGAIRKPPNVISWVIMLTRMATAGDKDFGAILRTPGLILCDYWHQKCVDFSIPKSAELADLSDACLHLSVLLMVTIFGIWPLSSLHKQFFECKFDFSRLSKVQFKALQFYSH